MNALFGRWSRFCAVFVAVVATCVGASAARASGIVRQGNGASPAALQPIVDQFRRDLGGANNGVGGSFSGGRREINWDDVPDRFSAPNNLPPDFFNVSSARGVVFHSVLEDEGSARNQFMVSATAASGTAVRFGDVNGTYPAQFTTFSAQRLFMPRQGHAMLIKFYKPGTTIEATTKGFGVVFTDVDSAVGGRGSIVYAYDASGRQLVAASAPNFNAGLSFVGVSFDAGERISHVIVKSGTSALGATTDDVVGGVDVVAMDDFIFGEPQPAAGCVFNDGFECPAP